MSDPHVRHSFICRYFSYSFLKESYCAGEEELSLLVEAVIALGYINCEPLSRNVKNGTCYRFPDSANEFIAKCK